VEDPFRGLQEILLHLHRYVSGQQAHQQPLLRRQAGARQGGRARQ
jgi:hypothetical protein